MQKILAIAWKDTVIRFSSRAELLFFLILPLTFTLILGQAFDGGDGDNRIELFVTDQDNSSLSAELVTLLAASDAVRPTALNQTEAEGRYTENEAVAWLTIPAGFETSLLAGETAALTLQTQPNNTNAQVVQQAVNAASSTVSRALRVAQASVAKAEEIRPFSSPEARTAYFETALTQAQTLVASTPERVQFTRATVAGDNSFNVAAHQSAGQLITWVFIPLLGTSGLFAYERTNGTLRRLLTTPTGKATYLLGVIVGQFGTALVQMLLLVGVGIVIMGLKWGQSPTGLAAMLVSFGLAATALGTFLGTFVKTEEQASNLSILFGMGMALLGGCWYPLEIFPQSVQTAVQVFPTTWAMQGMTDLVMRGQGFEGVMMESAVLLGFAVLFFAIGVWRFKYE